jgi:heme/copper-type cytochrome/quinol oxidase subunit 2
VTHGFYLDGYGLEQRVTPGMSQEIMFTADQPGKFGYRCSVSCGPLHPFMIGELVVNTNFPFWRAVALVAVTLTGTIIYLWRYERNSS